MRTLSTLFLLAFLCACGSDDSSSSPIGDGPDSSGEAADAAVSDTGPTTCPPGYIGGPGGPCMAVGIQGCDAMFIDPETGLCDPGLVACAPGQIPIFGGEHQGCQAIGVVDCHPDFLDSETGRCDPKPDLCPQGFIPIPTQGCVSMDPPGGCGEGTWGNIEALPGDVHVDASYEGEDSDGSREKPWTLYSYGIGKVDPGGRLVLAAGSYEPGVLVSKSMSLVGRCSSMVTLMGTREGAAGPTVLEVKGGVEAHISDLTISGPGYGLVALSGASVSLERSIVRDCHNVGVAAVGAATSLTATDVWIANSQADSSGQKGFGLLAQDGASVTLSRAWLPENTTVGILALGPDTSLEVSEIWVEATRKSQQGVHGLGLEISGGASVSLSQSLISGSSSSGIVTVGADTRLTASEVSIIDTQISEEGALGLDGFGLRAGEGSTVSLSRARLADNHVAGIVAYDPGTSVTIDETAITGTNMSNQGQFGRGIAAQQGAAIEVGRSLIANNHSAGIMVSDAGTTATISEVWIVDTETNGDGRGGVGLEVTNGAQSSLARSWVSRNQTMGVAALNADTSLAVSESWISDTRADAQGRYGYGFQASSGASADLSVTRVSGSLNVGVCFLSSGGSVEGSLIEGTLSGSLQLADGLLSTGSVVTVDRLISRDNARAGVLFDKSDGSLAGSLITENVFGLSNQGLPGAVISGDNVIEGNEHDYVVDDALEVPDEVMLVPRTSESDP